MFLLWAITGLFGEGGERGRINQVYCSTRVDPHLVVRLVWGYHIVVCRRIASYLGLLGFGSYRLCLWRYPVALDLEKPQGLGE